MLLSCEGAFFVGGYLVAVHKEKQQQTLIFFSTVLESVSGSKTESFLKTLSHKINQLYVVRMQKK